MGKMKRAYGNGGYSYSVNAQRALSAGRMTMTHAKKVVAKELGCTQKQASLLLLRLHDGEWHHVSKYANAVDFYDVSFTTFAAKRLGVQFILSFPCPYDFRQSEQWSEVVDAWENREPADTPKPEDHHLGLSGANQ